MARQIVIPPELKAGLEAIHALDTKTTQKLVKALKSEKPSLRYSDFASQTMEKVGNAGSFELEEILYAVIGLYSGIATTKMDAPEFVEAIIASNELDIPENEHEKLTKQLLQLLGIKGLEVTSKALNVFTDHERTFQSARIITDLRPVFETDPEQVPQDAVVLHILKIAYREGKDTKEFYVALDSQDLDVLQKTTERAVKKEKSAVTALQKSGMRVLS